MKIRPMHELQRRVDKWYSVAHLPAGVSSGMGDLDDIWRIEPGKLVIVTGIPSSGKSEMIDQVIASTIKLHGHKYVVYSPENWPIEHHASKLAEKWTGRSFGGDVAEYRMTNREAQDSLAQINSHIRMLEPDDMEDVGMEKLLEEFEVAYKEMPMNAVVIDPYSELAHEVPKGMNETQWLSQSLTRLRNWARTRNVTVFLVAHPKTMDGKRKEDGGYPVVTPYDISGGAKWYNAGDTIISIWRDYREDSRAPVEFHVQKVRNRRAGEIGKRDLFWSHKTGCYYGTEFERKEGETAAYRRIEAI